MYNLSEVLVSKSFFSFCGFTCCVRGFFPGSLFSMFVRVLGVRKLLQVLQFGMSEVSMFKCQRISSGLIFQFKVWVSDDSKI